MRRYRWVTTIVANCEVMCADSQVTNEDKKGSVQKLWKIRGWCIGGAGVYEHVLQAIALIKRHRDITPKQVLEDFKIKGGDEVNLLLLSPQGILYESEGLGMPGRVQDGFAAIGSGAQGALVAMNMGATPAEAVAAVKKVDPNTGGRLQTRKI
jgi:hypothetical protein